MLTWGLLVESGVTPLKGAGMSILCSNRLVLFQLFNCSLGSSILVRWLGNVCEDEIWKIRSHKHVIVSLLWFLLLPAVVLPEDLMFIYSMQSLWSRHLMTLCFPRRNMLTWSFLEEVIITLQLIWLRNISTQNLGSMISAKSTQMFTSSNQHFRYFLSSPILFDTWFRRWLLVSVVSL